MEKRRSGRSLSVRYWSCYTLFNVLVLSGLGLIIYKSFSLQILEYDKWTEKARAQAETSVEVPAYRGSIYDRRGRLLSYSVPLRSLFAEGDQADNARALATQLAPVLGEQEKVLEKKLSASRFQWVKRHLTDQQALAIETIKPKGVHLINEYKRFYPFRQVGGQVLGFVGLDGSGLEGVEKAFDPVLKENAIAVGQLKDGFKKCIWMGSAPPPDPHESMGVKLTMDAFIQYVSECELEKAAQKYHAKSAEVVVMDARTSEVLAMANWPFFDPNLTDKKDPESWRNRVITDSFEPGSTFKVFLMSAALEEGIVRERDRIFCENGKYKFATHIVNDVHPYGWLTIPEVIKHSSNIASAKIALQMGNERYYRYIQTFGFGAVTGISLPGEVKGLLRHHKRWKPIDLATTGFGQSIGVTALQLNTAVAAIANGGNYVQPVIATELLDSKGQTSRQLEPALSRRVIGHKTADAIGLMMKSVTEEGGTGVNAAPPGYSAAGKTGTAQTLDPATHRYACNKYTSIFTGYIPADNPRLAITVVVHEPHGAIYGGVVAAPVFREIAAKVLPYLGILPTPTLPPPGEVKIKSASAQKPVKPSPAVQGGGGSCAIRPVSTGSDASKTKGEKPASNSGLKSVPASKSVVPGKEAIPSREALKIRNNVPGQVERLTLKADNIGKGSYVN